MFGLEWCRGREWKKVCHLQRKVHLDTTKLRVRYIDGEHMIVGMDITCGDGSYSTHHKPKEYWESSLQSVE